MFDENLTTQQNDNIQQEAPQSPDQEQLNELCLKSLNSRLGILRMLASDWNSDVALKFVSVFGSVFLFALVYSITYYLNSRDDYYTHGSPYNILYSALILVLCGLLPYFQLRFYKRILNNAEIINGNIISPSGWVNWTRAIYQYQGMEYLFNSRGNKTSILTDQNLKQQLGKEITLIVNKNNPKEVLILNKYF